MDKAVIITKHGGPDVLELKKIEIREAKKLTIAVNEAKSRVYDKAKQQFEAGNAEFKSVRAQLKTVLAEQETTNETLKTIQNSEEHFKLQYNNTSNKLLTCENHLNILLQFKSVS